MSAQWVIGTSLSSSAQRAALLRFVHRCTVENFAARPSFERAIRDGGYRLRVLTDAEWLACTRFAVRRDGQLSARNRYCETRHPEYQQEVQP